MVRLPPTIRPGKEVAVIYENRVELRRSNASGTHLDKRAKRTRTRAASLAKELKDQQ